MACLRITSTHPHHPSIYQGALYVVFSTGLTGLVSDALFREDSRSKCVSKMYPELV